MEHSKQVSWQNKFQQKQSEIIEEMENLKKKIEELTLQKSQNKIGKQSTSPSIQVGPPTRSKKSK